MTNHARIAVVGAGSIGTVLADAAAQIHHDVTVCVRRPTSSLIVESGSIARLLDVTIADSPNDVEAVDWVLVTTKAHQTGSIDLWLSSLVGPNTTVVVCQNGIHHTEQIASKYPSTRVVPAVVSIAAERIAPGHVVHHSGNTLIVEDGPPGRALRDCFATSSVKVEPVADIQRAIWLKFLVNIGASPITTLTMRRMDVLGEPDIQQLLHALLTEALAVGRAQGVDLTESDVEATVLRLSGLTATTTSMQSDRLHGRPLELEELNGALLRAADEHGIDVPLNRALTTMLRNIA